MNEPANISNIRKFVEADPSMRVKRYRELLAYIDTLTAPKVCIFTCAICKVPTDKGWITCHGCKDRIDELEKKLKAFKEKEDG